jgi:hypothetical protein
MIGNDNNPWLPVPSGYFSAMDDKQNLTLKTGLRDWYKMESVSLGNGGKGNLGSLRADNVGVFTRFQWPSNASFTEGVTDEQLQAVKDKLRAGAYRKDIQAKNWAGYVVGDVLGLEMNDLEKQRVTRMLATWLKDGHLREHMAKVRGHDKPFLTA